MSRRDELMNRLPAKVRRAATRLADAQLQTHASSTAFFFFMSMVPTLLIVAYVMLHFGFNERDLLAMLESVMPEDLVGFAESTVTEAFGNARVALTISTVTLLWTSSQGFSALTRGLNAAYGVNENRGAVRVLLLSVVSIVALVFVVMATIYVVFSGEVTRIVLSLAPKVRFPMVALPWLDTPLLFAVGTVVFTLCYRFLPVGSHPLLRQVPGALFASASWAGLSHAFRIYVDHSSQFNLFYGRLAAVTLFLLWLYAIFLILLAGGFLNACLQGWQETREADEEGSPTEPRR